MSVLLKENADFVALLLNTSFIQAQALLDTITTKQIKAISEILKNLLKIPVGDQIKTEIEKNEKLIRKIAHSKIGLTKKARIIGLHRKKIIHILRKAKSILEAAIGRYSDSEKLEDSEKIESSG